MIKSNMLSLQSTKGVGVVDVRVVEGSGKVKSWRKSRSQPGKEQDECYSRQWGSMKKKSKIMGKYKWSTITICIKCKAGNGKR